MINKKLSVYLLITFLLLLPVLTACSTATIFDNNNVTQCALQSSLAEDITKSYALQIAGSFLQQVYSDQQFTEKQIKLNADGFTFKYALQQNDSGKSYILLKCDWQDLSSIVAEDYSSNFFHRRATRKYFKVQFEGIKTIQSAPADDQSTEIQKNTNILFEKDVTYFKHSRRDIALALLILSGRLSVSDAGNAVKQSKEVNSIEPKNYKLILVFILIACLIIIFKFKGMAATKCNRFCSTCQKKFDKDLDNCPSCGDRATEIITAAGWTYHIRNDTLPGTLYAYILAFICIFALTWLIATF